MIDTNIKNSIISSVRDRIDLTRDMSEEEIYSIISEIIFERLSGGVVSIKEKNLLTTQVYNAIRKLDILQDLIDDSSITEIMINGHDNIFVEKNGHIEKSDRVFESREKLEDVIQQIVSGCNRVVNESDPIVDARLENGYRVNVVLSPPALGGPTVTIRKFSDTVITLDKLVEWGSLTAEAAQFLKKAVISGYNCFVSGGTSSGKTTLLNALANEIPREVRLITIEDSAELRISNIPNLVSLETRNETSSGCKEISIRDLIKSSLRMRPDRIVVGEVRGAEALDMLQAFNTGHDGSLSTGHANSARDMLSRLETMVLFAANLPLAAIRNQIASGIDILIHLERSRAGKRRVVEIYELDGVVNQEIILYPLFVMGPIDELERVGELKNTGKWDKVF